MRAAHLGKTLLYRNERENGVFSRLRNDLLDQKCPI
jgi:hypothetical protein